MTEKRPQEKSSPKGWDRFRPVRFLVGDEDDGGEDSGSEVDDDELSEDVETLPQPIASRRYLKEDPLQRHKTSGRKGKRKVLNSSSTRRKCQTFRELRARRYEPCCPPFGPRASFLDAWGAHWSGQRMARTIFKPVHHGPIRVPKRQIS